MLRDFIINPNKIFNQETIFQKVDDSVLKNMWGGKAEYFSSMLPETSQKLKGTPLSHLNLVPLTTDVIMRSYGDKYKIPRNGEDKLLKDEAELKRLADMYNDYNKPVPEKDEDRKGIEALDVPIIKNNQEVKDEVEKFHDDDDYTRFNLNAQDLDEDTLAQAQPMIKAFGLDIMKKLFSAHWKLREEALKDILREVKLGSKSAL